MKNKKGQIWTLDYIMGMLIFIGLIATAAFMLRGVLVQKDTYSDTLRESDHIAAMLLGETSSNLSISGLHSAKIVENNRINETKLKNLSIIEYNTTKLIFQISGDYIFYFYNGTIINQTSCFHGYNILPDCNLSIPSSAQNIAKTERIVILNSSIVKLIVISWN